jgi:two-component system alkaline phosphatase synthesis response regulator PhoP
MMAKAKILLIDDEKSILDLITAYLDQEDYDYKTAADGESGLELALSYKPDLIVLDIMLPRLDGIELLTRLRRDSDVYVIMLTARGEETDKIIGLSVGADDYLSKPFSPRELVARIKAALRRLQSHTSRRLDQVKYFHGLKIDPNSMQAWKNDQLIELTTTEFEILQVLSDHHGMVLSREQLLDKVWGFDYYGEIRVVDVHVGHLRKKIGEGYITTVRGVGYRFESSEGS